MFKAKATRDERITSLAGHVFSVVAGEIYEFPDVMQTDAVLGGCIPVETASAPKAALGAVDRQAAVTQAVLEIVAKDDLRLLNPEGVPKIAAVKKLTGFEPTQDEVLLATDQMKQET